MNPHCDPEEHIGAMLHQLCRMMRRRMESVSTAGGAGSGSMPQGLLMHYLYARRGQDVFQRDIEHEFHVSRSSVTGILQNMEKAGLIVREPVAHDARLKRLRLTGKAADLHETVLRRIEENERDLTAGFTPEEVEQLRRLLGRIYRNLQNPQNTKEEPEPYDEIPAGQRPRV